MKIAFVQPTEASLINRDFWYVVNTDNPLEYETLVESTANMIYLILSKKPKIT